MLDQQPLPTLGFGAGEECAAVAGDLLTEADARRRRRELFEQPLQPRAAFDQRQRAQIVVALAQEVEGDEGGRLLVGPTSGFVERKPGTVT